MTLLVNSHATIGLSGGVDSAVSALLLNQQCASIDAMFMKNWIDTEGDGHCPIAQDLEDAQQVCRHLKIKFSQVNFAPEYWDYVFQHFLSEYRAGRTPNPDILCNKEIKFNRFLKKALSRGADFIATGHYAQIRYTDGLYRLHQAVDRQKDQTYFLYTLTQAQLSKSLFPIGGLKKAEVRELAHRSGLLNFNKKDSTGICFIGERKFNQFLNQFLPAQPGPITSDTGKLMGEHNGLMYHTLGQRKGLKIGGQKNSNGKPWFVVGKQLTSNTLIVGQGHDHPRLYSQRLTATSLHWVTHQAPSPPPYACYAKVRYRQQEQACTLLEVNDTNCVVQFSTPQRAITPGQSIVFYQGTECLGGGIIDHVEGILYA